jgi:hypothetical protein
MFHGTRSFSAPFVMAGLDPAIHASDRHLRLAANWIPAFAGMTPSAMACAFQNDLDCLFVSPLS